MSRCINFNDVVRDISILNNKLNIFRSKIDISRANLSKSPKILKWLYQMDIDDYENTYSRLLYRYKILQNLRYNFGKFVCGIKKSDYKDTHKLVDLLDRLKLAESVDYIEVALSGVKTTINDMRIELDSLKTNNINKSN